MSIDPRPIAMFDSGVGGLSILRDVRSMYPNEDILYFGDQGHVPYGPRPLEQIRGFVRGIVRFFLDHNAKIIVIPCNAASAAGLHHARELFPQIPIVGMEPAIKPAAERTQKGVIGVITTKATYQGELFASVVDRFAKDIEVVTQVCPEFVRLVEAGQFDGPEVRSIAGAYLQPLRDAGIDQMVIGCTHFPFLMPVLTDILGPRVEIVDPGPAIARQTGRIISDMRNSDDHSGKVTYYTSGDINHFLEVARKLVSEPIEDNQVCHCEWLDEETLQNC
jgi:glutamate racemase